MASAAGWLGRSIERVEDAALLTGRGRYIDDLGVPTEQSKEGAPGLPPEAQGRLCAKMR
jgi:CO/xanthine dehydrogenase Mo-binding subunit